jgi:hypothetical protein
MVTNSSDGIRLFFGTQNFSEVEQIVLARNVRKAEKAESHMPF